jgi:FkbM family methyltransferase
VSKLEGKDWIAADSRISRLLGRRGYRIYGEWRAPGYAQAQYLRQLFSAGAIDCVFDIGANSGQYHDFLRNEVGYLGKIVSVEPIPDLASKLRSRAKSDESWSVHECGLGEQEGVMSLHITKKTQFASFLNPLNNHRHLFGSSDEVQAEVQVPIRTLDQLFAEVRRTLGFERPYLKLDTQGFDLKVVEGAPASLQNFIALQTEASVQPLYEGMPTYFETIETLRRKGFAPSAFFPVEGGHFPELIEFDCHMVRQDLITELRARQRLPEH